MQQSPWKISRSPSDESCLLPGRRAWGAKNDGAGAAPRRSHSPDGATVGLAPLVKS
jgi:hypothetical protein